MEKWQEAYNDYKNGFKYREIAEKYSVSINTVKSWASRKWSVLDARQVAENIKNVANKDKKMLQPKEENIPRTKRKIGAPTGNKNAIGNGGGAPIGNQNRLKHGLYAKLNLNTLTAEEYDYFMNETIDIFHEIEVSTKLNAIQIKKFYEKIVSASDEMVFKYADAIGKMDRQKIRYLELLNSLAQKQEDDEGNKEANVVNIYLPTNERER